MHEERKAGDQDSMVSSTAVASPAEGGTHDAMSVSLPKGLRFSSKCTPIEKIPGPRCICGTVLQTC